MKSKKEIEDMYNMLLEIQANNIESSKEIDGFRRALCWVLSDEEE